jgi:hypothetical protein
MTGIRLIAAVALLAICNLADGALAQACVSREEARQLIDQGQVVTLAQAASSAGITDNQIVDAQLCQGGGGYVYRVRLRDGGQTDIAAN